MSWFEEQHAVVTGGGSGIGAAIAEDLIRAGAAVTIMGRGEQRLKTKAQEIGAAYAVADVTDRLQLSEAFSRAREEGGPITILVNNAGMAVERLGREPA